MNKCPHNECDGSGYYELRTTTWNGFGDEEVETVTHECRCLLERKEDEKMDKADEDWEKFTKVT